MQIGSHRFGSHVPMKSVSGCAILKSERHSEVFSFHHCSQIWHELMVY